MEEDALLGWPSGLVSDSDARARAFEAALPECTALAFRVAYAVLRHREDAEDVAQEVLAKAFRSLGYLRDPDRLRPWLARAAWRRALDRRREASRRERREERAPRLAPAPTAEELASSAEVAERVFRALDQLPEKLRLVLVLSAIDGHDGREVARLLGVAEGTVKSRLHAARKALVEKMR
jgi:RNA polymerase sigma-70 factor (ECF subfamily)